MCRYPADGVTIFFRPRAAGNGTGANSVSGYVRNPPIVDRATFARRRRGAGRWGVPVTVCTPVAMTVGVSAALAANRIEHGAAADGGRPTVTAPSGAAGR